MMFSPNPFRNTDKDTGRTVAHFAKKLPFDFSRYSKFVFNRKQTAMLVRSSAAWSPVTIGLHVSSP
jgi:hypothetical protein